MGGEKKKKSKILANYFRTITHTRVCGKFFQTETLPTKRQKHMAGEERKEKKNVDDWHISYECSRRGGIRCNDRTE